jgi:hypothetical protein
MPTTEQLLSAYQLANEIVEQGSVLRASGEYGLVEKAWAYSNAENARRQEEHNQRVAMKVMKSYPIVLAEQLERTTAKANETCEDFSNEYDAYRKRAWAGR